LKKERNDDEIIVEMKRLSELLECYSDKSWIEKTVFWFRNNWSKLSAYIISTGIIVLFGSSLIMKDAIEIQTMNSWVGIILGLVATFMSIIGMYLSFYNLDKSNKLNIDNMILLNRMERRYNDNIELMQETKKLFTENRDYIDELESSVQELSLYQTKIIKAIRDVPSEVGRVVDVLQKDFSAKTTNDFKAENVIGNDECEDGEEDE